ncbi:MAG TPA: SDR family NAD(P)-dependent oxidoreductase [Sumerlaeia bacterium]|nr:SDR family NAD(P)-dependent oxidoreductase [Sumerlaeia bacterium]
MAQQSLQALIVQQQRLVQASLELPVPPRSPTESDAPQSDRPFGPSSGPPLPPSVSAGSVAQGTEKGGAETARVLLDVIAEKTGYPAEMLELDMTLDSDLGIDSIKRVEILSALQEKLPEAPVIKPEHLGTLQTLRHLVEFLRGEPLDADSAAQPAFPGSPASSEGESLDAAAAAAPALMAASLSAGLSRAGVVETLFAVVAEKTGYPAEILEMEMGLEADLGIDSIKRVEILSALQEKMPEVPVIKPEHLGTLQTLGQIVEFLSTRTVEDAPSGPGTETPGDEKGEPTPTHGPPPRAAASEATPGAADAARPLERSVPVVAPLSADPPRDAISLPEGSVIWVMTDGSDLAWSLRELLCAKKLQPKLIATRDLKKTARPAFLGGLLILSPARGTSDSFLKEAFEMTQFAGPGLRNAGRRGGAVFATISRLDGAFGLEGLSGEADARSGGLAGLAKTARHEWPEVLCKALDLAGDFESSDDAAAAVVDEMLLTGPAEVGLSRHRRLTTQLVLAPLADELGPPPLEAGDVVLVTGGARGITAEVCVALARTLGPRLALLGRSKEPKPEPDWLVPLAEEAEIKRALLEQAGGRASPREIGEQYARVAANREILRNVERIEAANQRGMAVYRSVDVRDAQAVAAAVDELRTTLGPIRGLIHGAGVLADRRIEDKTRDQFEMVFDTKVAGLRAMLEALRNEDLKLLALFSSSTARFGRAGQIDYAMANEVLNKIAQQEARLRPDCRVLSLNWGPWAGGMVAPALGKMFEEEGIGLIGLRQGAEHFIREICATAAEDRDKAGRYDGLPVEVVVFASGAGMGDAPPAASEEGADRVREPSFSPGGAEDASREGMPPTLSLPLAFEYEIRVDSCPFLRSHVLDGKAVLPAAIMIEWLAHGALHANPGFKFLGFDDFRVLKGVILGPEDSVTLRVLAGRAEKRDDGFAVAVQMTSAGPNGRDSLHASAEIRLGNVFEESAPALPRLSLGSWPSAKDPYGPGRLFHGPDLQCIESVEGYGSEGIAATVKTAPRPSAWFREPLRSNWLADPLVLDGSFQVPILWCCEEYGKRSLPVFVRRYRQFRARFPEPNVRVVARIRSSAEHKAEWEVDILDPSSEAPIARLEGYECVMDASLKDAYARNRLTPAG